MLLRQEIRCAFCLAFASAGKSMLARMAIIAMTTSSSIKVNAPMVIFLSCFIIIVCCLC